jgi:hypothetical protein
MSSGTFTERMKYPECCFILSFSLTSQISKEFGDTLLEVSDTKGLFNSINQWLQKETSCSLEGSEVNYFDESISNESNLAALPHLSKRNSYSSESEYRLFFFCKVQKLVRQLSVKKGGAIPAFVNRNDGAVEFKVGALGACAKIVA